MTCLQPLPVRTLQRMALLSRPTDAQAAELGVELFAGLHALVPVLHRFFSVSNITDNAFATLVSLLALDPTPIAASDLSFHTRATRTTTSHTLDQLARNGWIGRTADSHDSRVVYVNLTPSGRALIEHEVRRFLDLAAEVARDIEKSAADALRAACRALRDQADHPGSPTCR